jgi:hypothetical protein
MAIPTVASKRRRIALALKIPVPQPVSPNSPPEKSQGDPYRGVVLVLAASALTGLAIVFYGGRILGLTALFDISLTLLFALGALGGVFVAMARRKTPTDQGLRL